MISIDCLILFGLVQCQGSTDDKAVVFHRVISPELSPQIPVSDRDMKTAIHFMISTATIIEELTRDMMKNPAMGTNFKIYQDKIRTYEPTYNGMIESFVDEIFGEFSNRISKKEFLTRLAQSGWKFFD